MRISDWSSDVCSSDLLADAVAAERRRLCRRPGRVIAIVASGIVGPVLLAGDVGAPGREAVGAVVDRTPTRGAVGRKARAHVRAAASRPVDVDLAQRRDTAVQGRTLRIGPAAGGVAIHLRSAEHTSALQSLMRL